MSGDRVGGRGDSGTAGTDGFLRASSLVTAGQLRTVSIAKGSVFCLPQHLESYAADVFGRLAAADRLRGLARDAFITALAGFLPALYLPVP